MTINAHADKYTFISPYVYVADLPTIAFDPDGKDIIILNAQKHVAHLGYAAVLIGNETTGWKLYSKN